MQEPFYSGSVVRPGKAFMLIPDDIWFEVVDCLRVRDIVRLRAVSNVLLFVSRVLLRSLPIVENGTLTRLFYSIGQSTIRTCHFIQCCMEASPSQD